jgi:hypothetical protein
LVSAEREAQSSRLLYTATVAALDRLHRLNTPANERTLAFLVVADEIATGFLVKAQQLERDVYTDVGESRF